jgi:hypothetical protein
MKRTINSELTGVLILILLALAPALFALSVARGEEPPRKWLTLSVIKNSELSHTDDSEEIKKQDARLFDIATAIDTATTDKMERAVLITIAVHETHLASYVYEGRCSDGPRGKYECDEGRAFGPWQLHAAPLVPVPVTTTGQAARALALYRYAHNRCKSVTNDAISAGLAHYGRGNSCGSTPSSDKRAKYARSIVGRL